MGQVITPHTALGWDSTPLPLKPATAQSSLSGSSLGPGPTQSPPADLGVPWRLAWDPHEQGS